MNILCQISAIFLTLAIAVSTTQSNEPAKHFQGSLEPNQFGIPMSELYLGKLKPSSTHKFEITLSNPHPAPFEFDSISSGCSCADISPERGTIPGNGVLTFTVDLKTVPRPSKLVYTASFVGNLAQTRVFAAKLSYSMEGIATFTDPYLRVAAPKGREFHLATARFACDAKTAEELSVTISESLKKLEYELELQSGALILKLPESAMTTDDVSGAVIITNKRSGYRDSLTIAFYRAEALRVFPEEVLFRPAKRPNRPDAEDWLRGLLAVSDEGSPAGRSVTLDVLLGTRKLDVVKAASRGSMAWYTVWLKPDELTNVETKVISVKLEAAGDNLRKEVSFGVSSQ